MTDFLDVAPPLDGLRTAMAAARRRRYRTATMTTGLGASLALVAPLLLGGSGQTVLMPEPEVRQPAVTASDAPVDTRVPDHVDAVAGNAPGAGPSTLTTGPSTSVPVSVAPTARPPARPSRGGAVEVAPSKPYAAGPMTRHDNYVYAPDTSCAYYDGRAHPTGLCPTAYAAAKNDGSFDLSAYVCNMAAANADLVYDSTNEVDFAISAHGRSAWRWSTWHTPRAQRHDLRIPPGSCSLWSVTWTGVDASGAPLKPGDYLCTASFLTPQLRQRPVSFTVTVG